MQRVLVIGSGGSGKTTVARKLADILRLPLVHLDAHYWRPGWNAAPPDEWRDLVARLIAEPRWVMDGNYGGTLDMRLEACDTVVFLDLPRHTCLWRILKRRFRYRGRTRPDIAPGCPEELNWEFVEWVWTYPKRRRAGILERLSKLPERRVFVLSSQDQVDRFLSRLQATRPLTSRREFLAASAVGFVGLASGSRELASTQRSQPDGELLYVGTYTEGPDPDGIFLVRMDSRTGELRRAGTVKGGANPSFLAIHPNGRILYAANEVIEYSGKASGAVSAFAIDADTGGLTRLNEQASEGGAPCYVSVDRSGGVVLVANYVGGNVALLPIQTDGSLAAVTHVVQHRGNGPNAERQEAAHAHCIIPDPSNRFALAADLGVDRVLVYRLNLDAGSLHHIEGSGAALRPGAGPRHLTFHPRLPLVFVANELDSTVTALRFDRETGKLSTVETRATLPAGWAGTNYVADIHVASNGRTLYVTNRGHNSIVLFSVADSTGALTLEQVVSTQGDWPRNFSLDPTGRWLLVANQRSGSVIVYARNQDNGQLTPTPHRIALPSPVCLRFRAHAGVTT